MPNNNSWQENIATIATNTAGAGANVNGQATMANSAPMVIASNQSSIPATQSGTWTVQPGNTQNTTPWSTESIISYWIRSGQAFTANGRGVTATNANLLVCPLSLFNPVASGKTIYLYSLKVIGGSTASTIHFYTFTTTDPSGGTGFTGSVTIRKLQPGQSASSVASACNTATGATASIAPTGVAMEEYIPTNNLSTELLSSGSVIVLPQGNGIELVNFVGTAGSYYQSCAKWIEY